MATKKYYGVANTSAQAGTPEDLTGPYVRDHMPARGAVDQAPAISTSFVIAVPSPKTIDLTTVVHTWAINEADPVVVYDGSAGGFQTGFVGTTTTGSTPGFENFETFTVNPDVDLPAGAVITRVTTGMDSDGVEITPRDVALFSVLPPAPSVDTPPVLTFSFPADGAVAVDTATTFAYTFVDDIGIAPASILIRLTPEGGGPDLAVNASVLQGTWTGSGVVLSGAGGIVANVGLTRATVLLPDTLYSVHLEVTDTGDNTATFDRTFRTAALDVVIVPPPDDLLFVFEEDGGHWLTLFGSFPDASYASVHIGSAGTADDPICYSGVLGQGTRVYVKDLARPGETPAPALQFASPVIAPGNGYHITLVAEDGSLKQTGASALVVRRNLLSGRYALRSRMRPQEWCGPRTLDDEP